MTPTPMEADEKLTAKQLSDAITLAEYVKNNSMDLAVQAIGASFKFWISQLSSKPGGNVLPELPPNWHLGQLFEKADRDELPFRWVGYSCELWLVNEDEAGVRKTIYGEGKTDHEAIQNAINKTGEMR